MKQVRTYFTVEATLLLPIIMSILLMAVSLYLFQYDRCLLEQDTGMLAIAASGEADTSSEDWVTMVKDVLNNINMEKYVLWEKDDWSVTSQSGVVKAEGGGTFCILVPEWNLMNEMSRWSMKTTRKLHIQSPVASIRVWRRLKEREEDGNRIY